MVSFASRRRRAITLRILSCGTASYEPGSNSARIFSSVSVCTVGATVPAAAMAGAAIPRPDLAASTSRAMTRPCGPEPSTRARSMPASFASRRASGDEKTRFVRAIRASSPAPSPRGETGAVGAGGAARAGAASAILGAERIATEGRAETPSPIGGGGVPALAGFAGAGFGASASLPAPAAAALTSSPSSASTAMSALTGTSCVPSGTTILASVPSSIASYSIVALSVSISAITSPGLTLSPSFLNHLARLPFSMVGDSAGIKILTGMTTLDGLADRAGGARTGRRVHLGIEHRADALERLVLSQLGFLCEDTRGMSGNVRYEHAPRLRVIESATQRNVQPPFYDGRAQNFDPTVLQRGRRNVQRVERRHRLLTGNRPPWPLRPRPRPKAARVFQDWPRMASARPCR